jgi:hypothetical protein
MSAWIGLLFGGSAERIVISRLNCGVEHNMHTVWLLWSIVGPVAHTNFFAVCHCAMTAKLHDAKK